jgi:hypothetical protein
LSLHNWVEYTYTQIKSVNLEGTSKNLAPLVSRVPNFIFWLKEGGFINELHVVFRNPFLHNEVLRKLNFLPVKFLEVTFFIRHVNTNHLKKHPKNSQHPYFGTSIASGLSQLTLE